MAIAPDELGPTFEQVSHRYYRDEQLFEREQERIFRGPTWNYVGLEVEIPSPGDYKTSSVGTTPVIVTRDANNDINVLVNKCAHRGAEVVRNSCGNAKRLRCLYHDWVYDLQGELKAVPFKSGVRGMPGYGDEFVQTEHGLERLRVETIHGLIFASFSDEVESVADYLGVVEPFVARIFKGKSLRVIGTMRHTIKANWKAYWENTKDPYHASLLHPFFTTFGLGRSTMKGSTVNQDNGVGLLYVHLGTDEDNQDEYDKQKIRTSMKQELTLAAPELVGDMVFEHGDKIGQTIQSIFPSLVIHQIANSLATRHVIPRSVDRFDIVWTLLGYADDDEDMTERRLVQANLVGPSGLVTVEDVEALEVVHRAGNDGQNASYVRMGGGDVVWGEVPNIHTENALRGFWTTWSRLVGEEIN